MYLGSFDKIQELDEENALDSQLNSIKNSEKDNEKILFSSRQFNKDEET